MEREEAELMNPLQLAYLGDTVFETLVRQKLILRKYNVRHMHTECVRRVNANSQAESLRRILPILTEKEQDIVRRGRNAHPKHALNRNQHPDAYAAATGFEALFGYLYLIGEEERLLTLFNRVMEEENNG